MLRRMKRLKDFDISIQIKNDDFIRPPRDSQRNWLLNTALTEYADNLTQLDVLAKRFVPGSEADELVDKTQTVMAEQEIMEDWQIPVMEAMAQIVAEKGGDVLEVGFGRGVSASQIQKLGVKSHTIIECNNAVVDNFQRWKKQYPEQNIRLIYGKWQDVASQLEMYDGIFFHTYPLNATEWVEYVAKSTTFAEHFFPTAAVHLRRGGVFTYFTLEIDSFSRSHQRLVFRYFSSLTLQVVPLSLPADLKDSWWADSMVVIKALKG